MCRAHPTFHNYNKLFLVADKLLVQFTFDIGLPGSHFSVFIPGVDLQGDQNSNDHQNDLAKGIEKVLAQSALRQQGTPDVPKYFDH